MKRCSASPSYSLSEIRQDRWRFTFYLGSLYCSPFVSLTFYLTVWRTFSPWICQLLAVFSGLRCPIAHVMSFALCSMRTHFLSAPLCIWNIKCLFSPFFFNNTHDVASVLDLATPVMVLADKNTFQKQEYPTSCPTREIFTSCIKPCLLFAPLHGVVWPCCRCVAHAGRHFSCASQQYRHRQHPHQRHKRQ